MSLLRCRLCGGNLEIQKNSNIVICEYCGTVREVSHLKQHTEQYDVFICNKEKDENGNTTRDSVIANDLYHQLIAEGLKVFFAPISLQDQLGTDYESFIDNAIDTASVMLVIGTKTEYFQNAWMVKQWSRFLQLEKTDNKRVLIPCYRDMDAFDLPSEFLRMQCFELDRVHFSFDLIKNIKRICSKRSFNTFSPRAEKKADIGISKGYAFISYSTKNQNAANSMRNFFHENGIQTWMAPNNIPVGSKYAEVIIKALKECSCLVLLLTNDSQGSIWVAKEVERAINYKKTIIPIQLEEVVLNDEFELYISTDQIIMVDRIREDSQELASVLRSVRVCVGE